MNASLVLGTLTIYLIGLTVVLALLHAEGERVEAERRSGVDGETTSERKTAADGGERIVRPETREK